MESLQATEDTEEDAPMIAKRGTFINSLLSCSKLPSLYSFLYTFGLSVSYDLPWPIYTNPAVPTGIPSSGRQRPKDSGSIQIEMNSDWLDFFITPKVETQKIEILRR